MNRRTKQAAAAIFTIGLLIFSFQNCGNTGGIESQFTALSSGEDDGVNQNLAIEQNKEKSCVSGSKLSIWLNLDTRLEYLGDVLAYEGSLSHADNYNYYSASAHPVQGPKAKGHELNVFFYQEKNGEYSLNFFANIDEGGSDDNQMSVKINISGNDNQDKVILSDDGAELNKVESRDSDTHSYIGDFHYWKNTDGGVIGPLSGSSFIIDMSLDKLGDNSEAMFYSADGSSFKLIPELDLTPKFIIKEKGYQSCN